MEERIGRIVEEAIEAEVCPGACVWIADQHKEVFHRGYGHTLPPGNALGGRPVDQRTIFDVASVTKAASTSLLCMKLVAEGKLSLDSKVAPLIPELQGPDKQAIELRHLLGHGSGLPAHIHFFDRIWAGDLGGADTARDALVQMAGAEPLAYETGTKTIYSDLGYILLGRLIERVGGAPLEVLFETCIAEPLGLADAGFLPVGTGQEPELDRTCPTEVHDSQGLLHGRVHDDNCRSGGGVAGHAGLFSTAADLGRIALELMAVDAGRSSFVSRRVLRSFWQGQAAPATTWRLGWDSPSTVPGESSIGDSWPRDRAYGHFGFTGCAMWLAPDLGRSVVLLSNRVYYTWEKTPIRGLRQRLFDAVMEELPASLSGPAPAL